MPMSRCTWVILLTVLGLAAFTSLGNFAAFFEIAAAARLDGSRARIQLLPLTFLGFTVSAIVVAPKPLAYSNALTTYGVLPLAEMPRTPDLCR